MQAQPAFSFSLVFDIEKEDLYGIHSECIPTQGENQPGFTLRESPSEVYPSRRSLNEGESRVCGRSLKVHPRCHGFECPLKCEASFTGAASLAFAMLGFILHDGRWNHPRVEYGMFELAEQICLGDMKNGSNVVFLQK